MKFSLAIVALAFALMAKAEPPVNRYLPPGQGGHNSGSHSAPSQKYGAPQRPSSQYGAPSSFSAPSSQYGAPSAPSSQYGAPSAPSSQYGAPSAPSSQYGAPSSQYSAPSSQYGAPSAPSSQYGAPSSQYNAPSSQYGAPNSGSSYNGQTQALFNKPSSSYNAPKPSQKYGAPSQSYSAPSQNYGAPSQGYSAPSNSYLPANKGGYSSGGYDDEQNNEPANYSFEYMVKDEESGNDFGHKESRQGDKAEGEYYVLLPDGRKQIVKYEADEQGYRPKITYEDVGAGYGRGPANQGYQSGPSGPY